MEKKFNPTLSVITVVYNNVKHIERTLKSVINQTYSDIEFIVIDGASTDGTLNTIEKYRSDIDILITFSPTAKRGLTETLQMRDELQAIFNRKVDLIVKAALKRSDNWLRCKNILESAQIIYASL